MDGALSATSDVPGNLHMTTKTATANGNFESPVQRPDGSDRRISFNATPIGNRDESRLMKALASNSWQSAKEMLQDPNTDLEFRDNDMRTALMYPQTIETVQMFCESATGTKSLRSADHLINDKSSNGQTVLMWQLIIDDDPDCKVAKYLIQRGSDINAKDHEGRTVLMTAVWKNRRPVFDMLLRRGVDVKVTDKRGRNALHHLAVDVDRRKRTGDGTREDLSIMDALLEAGTNINAQDSLGRTSIFSALHSENYEFANHLLGKGGIDLRLKSKSGYSYLHAACLHASSQPGIVKRLIDIDYHLDVQERTFRGGNTALHIAAKAGNIDVLQCLLDCEKVDRNTMNASGSTALFCANIDEPEQRKAIAELLAPWSHRRPPAMEFEDPSSLMRQAAESWHATVVDFGEYSPLGSNAKIRQYSVSDVIYKRVDDRPYFDINPATPHPHGFRWIHLPANNQSWCRDLIAKAYLEKDCTDTIGLRELERALHEQHCGLWKHPHSLHMTPMCQNVHSSPRSPYLQRTFTVDDDPDAGTFGAPGLAGPRPSRFRREVIHENNAESSVGCTDSRTKLDQTSPGADISVKKADRKTAQQDSDEQDPGHLFMFMPYLHNEQLSNVENMKAEINTAKAALVNRGAVRSDKSSIDDEDRRPQRLHQQKLLQAHLPNLTLHVRRTLDQFFYHSIDTKARDIDQVILRHRKRMHDRTPDYGDPDILMVDQLWVWIVDSDLIITSFPQKWSNAESDPNDLLEKLKEIVDHGIGGVHELVIEIISCCAGMQDIQDDREGYVLQVLNCFESEVGTAMDQEVKLFSEFKGHAYEASGWVQGVRRGNDGDFVKPLLNIGEEVKLLK